MVSHRTFPILFDSTATDYSVAQPTRYASGDSAAMRCAHRAAA